MGDKKLEIIEEVFTIGEGKHETLTDFIRRSQASWQAPHALYEIVTVREFDVIDVRQTHPIQFKSHLKEAMIDDLVTEFRKALEDKFYSLVKVTQTSNLENLKVKYAGHVCLVVMEEAYEVV